MKYEMTQGQYVNFLNTLTRAQQKNRVGSDISGDAPASGNTFVMSASSSISNRNAIQCPASGNGTTGPITFTVSISSVSKTDRACNYLSWMDVCAFADWSALRPMTELEYEKAARGPNSPVANEYAWGTASLTYAAVISGSSEDGTETITTSGANVVGGNTSLTGGDSASTGPVRVGIFATSTSTRVQAGAGYYGNMDLTGNVIEKAVTVGNSTGRSFTGTHGDGTLTTVASYEGNATNADWPGIDGTASRGVTGAAGAGDRGGAYTAVASLVLSRRSSGVNSDATRNTTYGGRAARTAP